jgi:HSP20 family protein
MATTPVEVKKTSPAPINTPDTWRALRTETDTLKGEKRQEKEQKDKNLYLSERSYGSFQRSFAVPENVDRDKIAADFAKGVLTITMPKTAKAVEQQKKIEVKAAA